MLSSTLSLNSTFMSNTRSMDRRKAFFGDADGKLGWLQIAEGGAYQIKKWVCL